MPDTPTHDTLTIVTALALAPICYTGFAGAGFSSDAAALQTGLVVGAHLLSGLLFSPDLDLNSAIDDRWGPFFWIWRPYMWIVPHRHFWSHGLVLPPLLRLGYFYCAVAFLLISASWALARLGIIIPDYEQALRAALFSLLNAHPQEALAFAFGFITGGAVHSVADWLVTGGKYILRGLGIKLRRNYENHDRWRPRRRWA